MCKTGEKSLLSPFIEDCLQRYPTLNLRDNSFVREASQTDFFSWLSDQLEPLDEVDFLTRLSELRRCVWAQLAYLEIHDLLPLEKGVNQLSAFACACLDYTARRYFSRLSERFGIPYHPDSTAECPVPMLWGILCMGKLGGNELNFSSDIDVIVCYDDSGERLVEYDSEPFQGQGDSGCCLTVQAFYQHFLRSLSHALNQDSHADYVFRVDMRLRPFGRSGALVCGYSYVQNYLHNHARDWERLAYAKARVLSANKGVEARFFHLIHAFVYRQYTDYGMLQSIRHMRDLISDTLHDHHYENDIKRGFGGIRLLEFSLQSIQFTLCRKYPKFKVRGAFHFLRMLAESGVMAEQVEEFYACLLFLRRLEHRLQIWQDKQTHLLPDKSDHRQWHWLAISMGYIDVPTLQTKVNDIRQTVQSIFEQILPGFSTKDYALLRSDRNYDEAALNRWLANVVTEEKDRLLLGDFIIGLKQLLDSRVWREATTKAQERLSQLLPRLAMMSVDYLQTKDEKKPQADKVNGRANDRNMIAMLFRLLTAILQRSVYLSLLWEYPNVLNRVLNWCDRQPWLIGQVVDYPMLLESVITPQNWHTEIHRFALRKQCQGTIANPQLGYEKKINQLREIKRSAVFKVAELNQTQALGSYRVSDHLTHIAREIVTAALHIAKQQLKPQWQKKITIDWDHLPILFVGYGKLGSFELSYGSDLDMVILYDDEQENAVSCLPFLLRLSRKTLDVLSLYTVAGKCYEVDCRLRPDGEKSLLVTGLSQYKSYLFNRAWVWEKQALIKARAVAGNRDLASQFMQIRNTVLVDSIEDSILQQEILSMREKMYRSLDQSNNQFFHLKHGVGGMIDIEFLTQYWTMKLMPTYRGLLYAHSVSTLLTYLSRTGECRLNTEGLIDIYLSYRAFAHQRSLDNGTEMIENDLLQNERQYVVEQWQQTFGAGFGKG